MVLIAVTARIVKVTASLNAVKRRLASNAVAARIPTVLTNRFCSIPLTKDVYPKSKSRLLIWAQR